MQRRHRTAMLLTVLASSVLLAACASDHGSAHGPDGTTAITDNPMTVTTTSNTTAVDPVAAFCRQAEVTIGAQDPPATLAEVAVDAQQIADFAAEAPPEAPWIVTVQAGAEALAQAAITEDPAAITDAAATLTTAYDELDRTAADIELASCSSESWGRQVVIAAIELGGAGG